jgi:elongation factor 1 alpha-like protein
VTLYLAAIDPIWVNVGCVLCEPSRPIPLASAIVAQIVAFELKFPLTAGSAVSPLAASQVEGTIDEVR